ncbi:hypothetical protein SCG7086_AK_00050 [Chlamydiales bacterium SCGC AG-110-P3]|nr:hypothetical protein SCG7086_AK_00050 [Chlamydiales bacterium SCGC AG-110-P3]
MLRSQVEELGCYRTGVLSFFEQIDFYFYCYFFISVDVILFH